MNNISTIIITSAATLLASVLGGLFIEYLRRIKPKLIFKVTDAVPIKLENKNLGANVITISNPSSKTIKEVVVKIKTIADKVQDGGIKVSEGLDYELSSEGNTMSVSMPFLKPKDELSITAISEGDFRCLARRTMEMFARCALLLLIL